MRKIEVNTSKKYDIIIGKNILSSLGKEVKNVIKSGVKLLIVTDSNVEKLYLDKVYSILRDEGYDIYNFVIPAGEEYKNFDTYKSIMVYAAKNDFCRDDCFVSLGGGVVGDMTGFCASSYMRGINFVQIPTTLLSGIDASIGGKTGFDLDEGKNLIGAFYQPSLVFFDVDMLNTLPRKEYVNGLGEGIKYAVLCGDRIEEIVREGSVLDNLEEFCYLCGKYKVEIVEKDEREGGVRALLNLGHTVGHAIEKLSKFNISHGVAVAMGIKVMNKASYKNGTINKDTYFKIEEMLSKLSVDLDSPFTSLEIKNASKNDKKARNDGINIVEILGIGDCRIRKMTLDEFGEYIG